MKILELYLDMDLASAIWKVCMICQPRGTCLKAVLNLPLHPKKSCLPFPFAFRPFYPFFYISVSILLSTDTLHKQTHEYPSLIYHA